MMLKKISSKLNYEIIAICIISFIFFYFSLEISTILNNYIPLFAKVKSKGTFYPNFKDFLDFHLFGLGLLGFIVITFSLFPVKFEEKKESFLLLIIFILLVFCFNYFISNPPLVNANFHYNKIAAIMTDSNRLLGLWPKGQTTWSYPFYNFINFLFYDSQPLLNGILAAWTFYLFYKVSDFYLNHTWISLFSAITFIFSGIMLNFVYGAEDLFFNVFLTLAMIRSYQLNHKYLTGIILFLVFASRPQNILLCFIILIPELIRWYKLKINDYSRVISNFFTFLIPFLILQFFLFYHDLSPWMRGIKLLSTMQPIPVDGFLISEFSGTFFGHFFWIFGIFFFPAILITLIFLTKKDAFEFNQKNYILGLLFSSMVLLLLYEKVSMFYFNFRYLSYLYPLIYLYFVIVIKKIFLEKFNLKLVFFILLLSPFTLPSHISLENIKKHRQQYGGLYKNRMKLRDKVKNSEYVCAMGGVYACRFASYVLAKDKSKEGRYHLVLAKEKSNSFYKDFQVAYSDKWFSLIDTQTKK